MLVFLPVFSGQSGYGLDTGWGLAMKFLESSPSDNSGKTARAALSGIGCVLFSRGLIPASSGFLDQYLRERYLSIADDVSLLILSVVFLLSACMAAVLFAQIARRENTRSLAYGIMAVCGLLSIFVWGGMQIALPAQIAFTALNVAYTACSHKCLRRDM